MSRSQEEKENGTTMFRHGDHGTAMFRHGNHSKPTFFHWKLVQGHFKACWMEMNWWDFLCPSCTKLMGISSFNYQADAERSTGILIVSPGGTWVWWVTWHPSDSLVGVFGPGSPVVDVRTKQTCLHVIRNLTPPHVEKGKRSHHKRPLRAQEIWVGENHTH